MCLSVGLSVLVADYGCESLTGLNKLIFSGVLLCYFWLYQISSQILVLNIFLILFVFRKHHF